MRPARPRTRSALCAVGAADARAASDPLRIADALPDRLSLEVRSRVRYEYLKDAFRALTSGDRDILVLRTLIHARVRATDRLTFGAEMIDSRAYLQDFPVSTGIVDAVDLLQGYAKLDTDASACTGCSAPCLGSCPLRIDIPERTAEAHRLLTLA